MTTTRTCKRCGATFGAESPAGLCPRCLLQAGLGASDEDLAKSGSRASRPPLPTPAELAPHFPQLDIDGVLGQGGMGVVYRARQRALQRPCALKILTVDVDEDARFAERFEREARTLASLAHPGLVTVYDFGRSGPYYYFVMELVDGVSLRQMMRAGRVAPSAALALVEELCQTLQFAHDHGVVHRDIKPENILVDRRGRVKVLDFGLAKLVHPEPEREVLTRTGQAMGTPHYMAPEQYERPLEVDHRADIFSLGVVFYELLTGELPVGRFAPPSRKVEVDVRLDEVVLKTLEKEPRLRYQQASEVATDVHTIAAGPAAPAAPASASGCVPSQASGAAPERRPRRSIGLIVAVVVLVLALPCLILGAVLTFALFAPVAVAPEDGPPAPVREEAVPLAPNAPTIDAR